MNPRARWPLVVASTAVAVSLSMVGFSVASLVMPGAERLPERPTFPMIVAACSAVVTLPLVGALVAVRRPDNPIGWLFIVIGLMLTVGIFASEYVWRVLLLDLPLPGAAVVAWVADWSFSVWVGLAFTWLPLLFPTGRMLGPAWRLVLWASTTVIVLGALASAFHPAALDDSFGGRLQPPLAAPANFDALLRPFESLFLPAILVLGLLSIGSLALRFRRARTVERQQIKWVALSTAAFIAAIAVGVISAWEPVFVVALFAAASIPVSAGIAILRYRLFEIDRIISRTLSWAIITGLLVATFGVLVVGLQALLDGVTQGQTLAVAASTLVAFALFQPVRQRVQRVVDRRFDRARYDGERTAAAFAERLRHDLDLDALVDDLTDTVGEAVRPTGASLWLLRAIDRP